MLVPSFRIELGNSVVSGQVTMGMFDGRAPSIAGVTGGNSVFIHQPQREGQLESGLGGGNNGLQTKQLSINRNITAIGCGDLDLEGRQRDVLLVGSNTNLMAYDVEDNRDIFFKDVSDGVTVLCTGHVPEVKDPLAIVGGNCSIQGFDREGNEAYWYVTGDNVTAMCLLKKVGVCLRVSVSVLMFECECEIESVSYWMIIASACQVTAFALLCMMCVPP
jgi:Bardet-Biedl syndrome 2 protein